MLPSKVVPSMLSLPEFEVNDNIHGMNGIEMSNVIQYDFRIRKQASTQYRYPVRRNLLQA